jgi:hypothetical protein
LAQQGALLLTINNGSLRLVGGQCNVGDNGVLLMPGSSMLNPASNDIVMDDSQQPRRSLFGECRQHHESGTQPIMILELLSMTMVIAVMEQVLR